MYINIYDIYTIYIYISIIYMHICNIYTQYIDIYTYMYIICKVYKHIHKYTSPYIRLIQL